MGNGARDWDSVPKWDARSDDLSASHWLMKGLEGVVDIAEPLLDSVIDD